MRLTRPLKPGLTFRGFHFRLASIDAVPLVAFLVDIAGIVTQGLILLLGGLILWPLIMMLGDPGKSAVADHDEPILLWHHRAR